MQEENSLQGYSESICRESFASKRTFDGELLKRAESKSIMDENITSLVNAVKSLSMQVRNPGSPNEAINGGEQLQFKKGIKAQSKLLNLNASEELHWLVSRLSHRVKAVLADVENDSMYKPG